MASKTFMTYRERISQTKDDKKAQQVDVFVQQSQYNIKSAVIQAQAAAHTAEGEVIKAQSRVSDCQSKVDAALASTPLNVQSYLNAVANLDAAREDVTTCEESVAAQNKTVASLTKLQKDLGL